VLVAESFAGPLALEYAAENSDRVEGIVLSASFVANPLHPWLNMARSILGTTEFTKPPPDMFVKKLLLGAEASEGLVSELKDCLDSVRPDVLTHRMNMVTQVNAGRFLTQAKVPLLYLLGKQDQLVADRGWKAIEEQRPDAVCVEIDAPHMILQTQPEAAFLAIRAFMEKLESAREVQAKTPGDPLVLSS
jgi:pimeloyl-ACP methyl ester carboxylesterase